MSNQIGKALADLIAQRDRLNEVIVALTPLAGRGSRLERSRGRPAGSKRRRMSLAARKRIAAAQRARWAKVRYTLNGSPDFKALKLGGRIIIPQQTAKVA